MSLVTMKMLPRKLFLKLVFILFFFQMLWLLSLSVFLGTDDVT